MRINTLVLVAALALPAAGCDQLFPEFGGAVPDLGGTDASGADMTTGMLVGGTCRLTDLRSPSSCATALVSRHVSLLETSIATDSASDGTFSLSLAGITTTATLVVSDPTQSSVPTVAQLTGTTLTAARARGILLASVDPVTLSQIELDNGIGGDDTRGAILGWVLGSTGAAMSGAVATRITSAIGPLYDTTADSQLEDAAHAGASGTVAFFDLPAGKTTVTVAPSSGAAGTPFSVPVFAGAITTTTLTL